MCLCQSFEYRIMAPTKRNFYEVIKLNYILSKLFGFCQITINYEDISQSCRVTYNDFFILICWTMFYCFNTYNTHQYSIQNFSSKIYFVGIIICDKIVGITLICMLWTGFLNRGSMRGFFKKIMESDQMVCKD